MNKNHTGVSGEKKDKNMARKVMKHKSKIE